MLRDMLAHQFGPRCRSRAGLSYWGEFVEVAASGGVVVRFALDIRLCDTACVTSEQGENGGTVRDAWGDFAHQRSEPQISQSWGPAQEWTPRETQRKG